MRIFLFRAVRGLLDSLAARVDVATDENFICIIPDFSSTSLLRVSLRRFSQNEIIICRAELLFNASALKNLYAFVSSIALNLTGGWYRGLWIFIWSSLNDEYIIGNLFCIWICLVFIKKLINESRTQFEFYIKIFCSNILWSFFFCWKWMSKKLTGPWGLGK